MCAERLDSNLPSARIEIGLHEHNPYLVSLDGALLRDGVDIINKDISSRLLV